MSVLEVSIVDRWGDERTLLLRHQKHWNSRLRNRCRLFGLLGLDDLPFKWEQLQNFQGHRFSLDTGFLSGKVQIETQIEWWTHKLLPIFLPTLQHKLDPSSIHSITSLQQYIVSLWNIEIQEATRCQRHLSCCHYCYHHYRVMRKDQLW